MTQEAVCEACHTVRVNLFVGQFLSRTDAQAGLLADAGAAREHIAEWQLSAAVTQ